MASEVEIREASSADIDALVELAAQWRELLQHSTLSNKQLRESLVALLDDSYTEFLICYSSAGAPLGFVQQRYRFSLWAAREEAYLEDLFLVEEARGRGIGSQLLESAISRAKSRDCGSVSLYTNSSNMESIDLYERQGFHSGTSRYPDSNNLYFVKTLLND